MVWADQISSVSDYEFVCLVAHFNTLVGESNQTSNAEFDSRYTPAQITEMKRSRAKTFNPITSCNLRFTRPFEYLKFQSFGYVLTLYDNYKRGCLPFPGTVSEQPAKIIEIFSIIQKLYDELELKVNTNGRNQYQNQLRTGRQSRPKGPR